MTKFRFKIDIDFNETVIAQKLIVRAREALLELMLAIEGHAKRLARVDTGRMRASITTEPKRPANIIKVRDGVKYGIHQELGTVNMAASPFMRPAKTIAVKKDLPRILKRHGLK